VRRGSEAQSESGIRAFLHDDHEAGFGFPIRAADQSSSGQFLSLTSSSSRSCCHAFFSSLVWLFADPRPAPLPLPGPAPLLLPLALSDVPTLAAASRTTEPPLPHVPMRGRAICTSDPGIMDRVAAPRSPRDDAGKSRCPTKAAVAVVAPAADRHPPDGNEAPHQIGKARISSTNPDRDVV